MNLSVRKPLVIDYKLPYPTGTATGVMINSFFTNGDLAKQQVTDPWVPAAHAMTGCKAFLNASSTSRRHVLALV